MISRRILLHSLLLVLVLISLSPSQIEAQPQRQRQQPTDDPLQQSTVPGEGDIAIMQKEIKWGMEEMQRYKSIRGAWPVRVHDDDVRDDDVDRDSSVTKQQKKNAQLNEHLDRMRDNNNSNNNGETQSVRGAVKPEEPAPSAHHSYWNLLVSVF